MTEATEAAGTATEATTAATIAGRRAATSAGAAAATGEGMSAPRTPSGDMAAAAAATTGAMTGATQSTSAQPTRPSAAATGELLLCALCTIALSSTFLACLHMQGKVSTSVLGRSTLHTVCGMCALVLQLW